VHVRESTSAPPVQMQYLTIAFFDGLPGRDIPSVWVRTGVYQD